MLLSLFRSGCLLFFGIMLGRATGFIREVMVGSNYGSGSDADAVVLMFTIPDLLINVLLAGGLSSALIPEFKRLSSHESWHLFIKSSFFIGIAFFVFMLIAIVFAHKILFFFVQGLKIRDSNILLRC